MKRFVAAVALALLAGVPAADAHHYAPVRPGGRWASRWCTFNFVFSDAAGNLYIGTAGHCATGIGQRADTFETGEFGTVVYRTFHAGPPSTRDFALIQIDADKHDLVDPSVSFWGGPTGVATSPAVGSGTVSYGWGRYLWHTEATRPRAGLLKEVRSGAVWGEWDGWYVATNATQGGDSGSGVMTSDGAALGVVTRQPDTGVGTQGPLLSKILADARADGWDISLVTAPFAPPWGTDPAGGRVPDTVRHCAGTPVGLSPADQPCAAIDDGVVN